MASSPSSVQSRPASPPKTRLGSETPRVFTPPLRPLTPKTSAGFALIAFADEVLEMPLLPWQEWLAIHALELLPDGSFRFRTVLLLVARQNGKSTFLQILALFFMYVRGVQLVIGTAQNLDIAEEVWQGAVDIARDVPDLADEIEHVNMTNGKKALILKGRERYKVQAANRRGGRGLSGDLVMLDELREHQNWLAWGAVTKTTMARMLAQVWAASNAGDAASVVLRFLRFLAHAALGNPDALPSPEGAPEDVAEIEDDSFGIFEWSAPPGCDMDDRDGWAQANPSLGYTITERAIASARRTDPEQVFRVEVLCQWVNQMDPDIIDPSAWAVLARKVDRPAQLTYSLEVPMGRESAVVGAAWTFDGKPHVEVAHVDEGTGWVVEWLKAATTKRPGPVMIDGDSEGASLIPELEKAGVRVIKASTKDRAAACGSFYDLAVTGGMSHDGNPDLADALAAAAWKVSEQGVRTFSRRRSGADISHLYAATFALHGLLADQSAPPNLW